MTDMPIEDSVTYNARAAAFDQKYLQSPELKLDFRGGHELQVLLYDNGFRPVSSLESRFGSNPCFLRERKGAGDSTLIDLLKEGELYGSKTQYTLVQLARPEEKEYFLKNNFELHQFYVELGRANWKKIYAERRKNEWGNKIVAGAVAGSLTAICLYASGSSYYSLLAGAAAGAILTSVIHVTSARRYLRKEQEYHIAEKRHDKLQHDLRAHFGSRILWDQDALRFALKPL